jgi:hypothetical protein
MQHLPFILEADAGVKSEAKVTPKMANDKVTASSFMTDLLMAVLRGTIGYAS